MEHRWISYNCQKQNCMVVGQLLITPTVKICIQQLGRSRRNGLFKNHKYNAIRNI